MKIYSGLLSFLFLFVFNLAAADGATDYHKIKLEGWDIYIEKTLVIKNDRRVFLALRIMREKLHEISETLPGQHVSELKTVPLWISKNNGTNVEYYFYEKRIYRNGIDPRKLGGIEFKNISIFLVMVKKMPGLIIHELAHAYHKMNYKKVDPLVMRAYKHAQQKNLYRTISVERNHHGKSVYASKNPYEYFADLSAMYFGTNDYFPYNRDDLEKHDPKGYQMIEQVWEQN